MLIVFFLLFTVPLISAFEFVFKPGPLIPASKGEVWPKPQHQDKLDTGYFSVLPTFFQIKVWFQCNSSNYDNIKFNQTVGNTCSTLKEALDRYRKIIIFNNRRIKEIYFKVRTCYDIEDSNFLGYLTSVEIDLTGVCNDEEYPSIDMKEECKLNC